MDFPTVTVQQFIEAAHEGEKSLDIISDMVLTFANAQNESYRIFKEYKFGETLNPVFEGRPPQQMTNNAFNALFKSELIKVLIGLATHHDNKRRFRESRLTLQIFYCNRIKHT